MVPFIDYSFAEELATLRSIQEFARTKRLGTTGINVRIRTFEEIVAPYAREETWRAMCQEINEAALGKEMFGAQGEKPSKP